MIGLLTLAFVASTDVPGTIVAFSPAASRQYIGSPGLAVLPNGDFVASHDFFGPGSTRDTTAVYGSTDRGKTWTKRATIIGQWWSTLFVHRDALYLFGTSKEYGTTVIRRSRDGGTTWTEPKDADSGLLIAEGRYHCAPVPLVIHRGRIWRAMEEYTGPKWGAFRSFAMSAPVDADLLKAASWTSTNRLDPDTKWLEGKFGAWLEGNVVVDPKGEIVNILRVQHPDFNEWAAMVRISSDGNTATFDPALDFIPFPGGSKKFTIRYDPVSKRYWTLCNFVSKEHRLADRRPDQTRNTLSLASSADLRTWTVERTVLTHPDAKNHGFQYVEWLFEKDDLIAMIRMAHDEPGGVAHNAHDANYLTFLRVVGFRTKP